MRYLALITSVWVAGCGTTVIGDGIATGGSVSVGTGGSPVAGAGGTGIVPAATGGVAPAATGGAAPAATGGAAPAATGGVAPAATGGAAPAATGGAAPAATGGAAPAATGGASGQRYCGDSIVRSQSNCMLDDAYCLPLSDGRYCTGGWVAPCPDGTSSMASADCPANEYWCWQHSMSTTCRLPLRTSTECTAAGGIVQSDPGDGSLHRSGCASPLVNLGLVDATAGDEGGICCGQGSETAAGPNYCGGTMVPTVGQCMNDDAFCQQLSNGQYCTGGADPRCPPGTDLISFANCPQNAYWCWRQGFSAACALPTRTPEDCTQSGGEVRYDPGDGSVVTHGCTAPLIDMGLVQPGGIEGAVCCGVAANN